MGIGIFFMMIMISSVAVVLGRHQGEDRWGRREQNQEWKRSQIIVIISMIIAISCVYGALGVIRTPQPPPPKAVQIQETPVGATISSAKPDVSQNQKVHWIPEEIADVMVQASLAQNKVQVAPGPLILQTIFGNLFVISIIANVMGRKNPNFRKTKRAASAVIWCLFLGILGYVNRQRNATVWWMEPGSRVTRSSSVKPGLYANNGINPIPEEIQAELRAELKQAAALKTELKSNKPKKPAKIMPEDLVEYKLQSAPCATREKAVAEVEEKLRQMIAERLRKYNLTDEQSIRTTMESLKPKTMVSESVKEVGGETYPIYTGTIEIALGRDFDQGVVRQLNSLSARNRYEWLMAGSVLAVILLALVDRLILAGAKPADGLISHA